MPEDRDDLSGAHRARESAARHEVVAAPAGRWSIDDVFALFPLLRERADAPGGVLSGGEQQMLTICRTLMGDPDLVMIDEPTEGLAPRWSSWCAELLEQIAARGVAILLIEQKLTIALAISHRLYVMGQGRIVFEGTRARRCATITRCARNGSKSERREATSRPHSMTHERMSRTTKCAARRRHHAGQSAGQRPGHATRTAIVAGLDAAHADAGVRRRS